MGHSPADFHDESRSIQKERRPTGVGGRCDENFTGFETPFGRVADDAGRPFDHAHGDGRPDERLPVGTPLTRGRRVLTFAG